MMISFYTNTKFTTATHTNHVHVCARVVYMIIVHLNDSTFTVEHGIDRQMKYY